jgi:hypothetical protein
MLDASGQGAGGSFRPLLADLTSGGTDEGLDQVVAGPHLEQPVGDVHVDDLAAVVLADAERLPGHRDDAVAGDPASDPVVTAAPLGQRGQIQGGAGVGGPGGEPLRRRAAAERLMRPVGVVLGDPAVDRL